jgi:hypothetical protein
MGITVYVSPKEWRYITALKTIAEFEAGKVKRSGQSPRQVSRYAATRVLKPLEDFVMGRLDKASTVAKMVDILERDYGFDDEEEQRKVTEAIVRLVDEMERIKRWSPEHVFDFLDSLRYALLGFFRGYIVPQLKELPSSQG